MVSLKVEIKLGDFFRKLNSVTSRLRNPERGLRRLGPWGLQAIDTNFKTESSGINVPIRWAPLAETTAKERARELGPAFAYHPILQRTQKLRRSIRYKVRRNELIWYTQVKYAQYHVTGTHKMPARNFMIINSHTINRMAEYLIGWIFEEMKT